MSQHEGGHNTFETSCVISPTLPSVAANNLAVLRGIRSVVCSLDSSLVLSTTSWKFCIYVRHCTARPDSAARSTVLLRSRAVASASACGSSCCSVPCRSISLPCCAFVHHLLPLCWVPAVEATQCVWQARQGNHQQAACIVATPPACLGCRCPFTERMRCMQSTRYLALSLASHRALMAQAAHMPNSFSPACISKRTHAHSTAHNQSCPTASQCMRY